MKEEEDDDVDPEVELACLKQNESDEEKLLEESEEVRLLETTSIQLPRENLHRTT